MGFVVFAAQDGRVLFELIVDPEQGLFDYLEPEDDVAAVRVDRLEGGALPAVDEGAVIGHPLQDRLVRVLRLRQDRPRRRRRVLRSHLVREGSVEDEAHTAVKGRDAAGDGHQSLTSRPTRSAAWITPSRKFW